VSAGWDAAVTRAARAFYDAFPTVRSTRRRGPEPQPYFDLPEHAQRTWQSHARAALTAAVGPGGLILEARDVSALWKVLDHPVVRSRQCTNIHDEADRLRSLLDSREGAG